MEASTQVKGKEDARRMIVGKGDKGIGENNVGRQLHTDSKLYLIIISI